MAEIFFDGKIYIGVLPTYPERDYEVLEHTQYKRYIVTGSHSFKDGQDVTGLYELQQQDKQVRYTNGEYAREYETITVALPIQQEVSTQQEQMTECYFTPDKKTTSATICVNCGKEKMLHTIGEGMKVKSIEIHTAPQVQDIGKEEVWGLYRHVNDGKIYYQLKEHTWVSLETGEGEVDVMLKDYMQRLSESEVFELVGKMQNAINYNVKVNMDLIKQYSPSTSAQHHASAVDHEKVWVWRTDNPGKDVNDTFVCIIEQRGNGKVTQKPAYAQWMYSSWMTEEGWKVIEWLESTPLPNEATIEKIKEYLFNTANAGVNINADYLKQTIEFLQSL